MRFVSSGCRVCVVAFGASTMLLSGPPPCLFTATKDRLLPRVSFKGHRRQQLCGHRLHSNSIVHARPPGLELAKVDPESLEAAVKELDVHFWTKSGHLEAGVSHGTLLNRREIRSAVSFKKLPITTALLNESMAAFGFVPAPASLDRVALLARRYRGWQSTLKFHKDAYTLFEEPVFGLVLRGGGATAPRLILRSSATSSKDLGCVREDDYEIDEQPGTVLQLRGPARYEWRHGVLPRTELASKERVSLTWRWLRKSVVHWGLASAPDARGWVGRFVDSALQLGFSDAVVAAFLGGWAATDCRGGSIAEHFSTKDRVAAPWLRAAEIETALLEALRESQVCGKQAVPSSVLDPLQQNGVESMPKLVLALLKLWEEAEHPSE